jgi:eukaryotic-like serine/threonine-protein kinase
MSTTRGQHLIGQVIGSYILETLLGYGGSSAVFLAQNHSNSEKVAVKVFLSRTTMDRQAQKNFYRRFLREAEAASELDHPNILSIYSYGEYNGLPYIVMPYMSGGTLTEYITRYGPLSLSQAQHYLAQISSALDYAHENGRVHCDVKPANILLDDWGEVVLSDFGIVHLMQPNGQSTEPSMKSPETLMGTPDYISPEQALGEPLDGRSDVYSLAVTLFFLLAGRPPFQADTSIAIALMHVDDTPPLLSTMRSDITPQIDHVIAKALAKWPEDRYQTAGNFSASFAEAVANADNYVLSASEAKRKAIFSSGGVKKAISPLKLIVQDKPTWKGSSKLLPIALPFFLLIVVIIGSVLSINTINRFTNARTHVQSTPPSSQTDYLADENSWPNGPENSPYFFKKGLYHINNKSPLTIAAAFYSSDSESKQLSNFRLTVTVSEIHGVQNGGDYYGIILRTSGDQQHYYLFEVSSSFGGQYEFLRYDGPTKKKWDSLVYGHLTSLSTNFGHTNNIAVVAKGNTFTFSVNKQQLGKPIIDTSNQPLNSGAIGLSVEGQDTEVAFSHLYIDRL